MKAAIYCRVSTDNQEQEGTSLQSQLDPCLKLAHEKGYEVEEQHIIKEVYSGLTLDRPDLAKLRRWLDNREVDSVIIYSSDRFSRDGYDFLTLIRDCQQAEVELLCVTEPIEDGQVGELLSYIRGWASKLEADKIKERTIRGKVARAKGGRLLGGSSTKPYGYNYLPGKGVGEGVRYINEEQAKWVREIYRWFVEEGLSLNGIVYRLRALNVPSPSGNGIWGKATLHRILTNPAYIGKTYAFTQTRIETQKHRKAVRKNRATHIIFKPREEWVEIPNATPPIISEELLNRAKARLQRNKVLAARNARRQYLLRGYVFCRHCGRRYAGAATTTKTKDGIELRRFYRCPKSFRVISPIPCRNRQWNANKLEMIVWRQIEALLTKPEVILVGVETKQEEAKQGNFCQGELETVLAQLRHMEKEKDRVWKAFEITGDEDKFRSEISNTTAQMEELERQKLETENRIEMSQQAEIDIQGIQRFCELVSSNLTNLSFEDKRLALEALDIKVWLDRENVTIEGTIPVADSAIASTTLWHSK